MSVYFLTPNAGSGGDTITHGDDDDMSLARWAAASSTKLAAAILSALLML
jgi:hypothetical protein